MADLFSEASSWLNDVQREYMSTTVTYTRGNQTVELDATLGRTEFEVLDAQGLGTRVESRDFIVDVAQLGLTPERWDRITDGSGNIYEVLNLPGVPFYRYSDYNRTRYRIHTKLIEGA